MQAILVLYFADTLATGGPVMSAGTAASVSAAYGTLVYLVSAAGGRLADRVLGSYRAVLWGGVPITCGHYALAVPTATMTWVGLGLTSAGTGLLKPNVAPMAGKLYRTDDDRRDAGFTLSYMAIDIGAFAGPLVTGRLGDHQGRRWGFSAAAIGMTFGLVQYVTGRRHLAGRKHAAQFALAPEARRRAVQPIATGLVIATALVSVIAPAGYFVIMFMTLRVTPEERGRLRPYVVLFLSSTVFNFVPFQAYSTMMLPPASNAETTILGFDFPTSW